MKKSAGILVYRCKADKLEVFLIHPGGPLFSKRDMGVWSIPKGEYDESRESALDAARREFKEETGFDVPVGELIQLSPVRNISGKIIRAWAIEGDFDASGIVSNKFKMWGKEYPEADKADWFSLEEASKKITPSQRKLLDELAGLMESKK